MLSKRQLLERLKASKKTINVCVGDSGISITAVGGGAAPETITDVGEDVFETTTDKNDNWYYSIASISYINRGVFK